ncbi:hypothetical protein RDI58_000546 [Solanum bulbocastanum]|uniref:Uncharacterized protein n=1 Tax=Solanum bulbocastanum TaxID=147425 RepID=A0AAN8U6B8_SOLBU
MNSLSSFAKILQSRNQQGLVVHVSAVSMKIFPFVWESRFKLNVDGYSK